MNGTRGSSSWKAPPRRRSGASSRRGQASSRASSSATGTTCTPATRFALRSAPASPSSGWPGSSTTTRGERDLLIGDPRGVARVPSRPAPVERRGSTSRRGADFEESHAALARGGVRPRRRSDADPHPPGAGDPDLRPHVRDHLRPGGDRDARGDPRHGRGAAEPRVRPAPGAGPPSHARRLGGPGPPPRAGPGRGSSA